MDDIKIVELETVDRRTIPHVLTLAVYQGRVFYFVVETNRPPYPYYNVDLTLKRAV